MGVPGDWGRAAGWGGSGAFDGVFGELLFAEGGADAVCESGGGVATDVVFDGDPGAVVIEGAAAPGAHVYEAAEDFDFVHGPGEGLVCFVDAAVLAFVGGDDGPEGECAGDLAEEECGGVVEDADGVGREGADEVGTEVLEGVGGFAEEDVQGDAEPSDVAAEEDGAGKGGDKKEEFGGARGSAFDEGPEDIQGNEGEA